MMIWFGVRTRKKNFQPIRDLSCIIDEMFIPILERINDNTYKVNLSGDYGVSIIFDVFYHSLFDVGDDLISNMHYKRFMRDVDWVKGKKIKEVFNWLLQNIEGNSSFKIGQKGDQALINVIHATEVQIWIIKLEEKILILRRGKRTTWSMFWKLEKLPF
jgi:hypothetical protein